MKIVDLINEEKLLLEKDESERMLSDILRLKKISNITSIYFDTLCSYAKTHTIKELEEYKAKIDEEDIVI